MRPASLFAALITSLVGALPHVSIMEIQGRGHLSPFAGDSVVTMGVVTAVVPSGFFAQDPGGDGDPATSDAIFAFTGLTPAVEVGDRVRVVGLVTEFLPGADPHNLTVTEVTRPRVDILSKDNPLPHPAIIDCQQPTEIVDDDALASFDAAWDGIDFYESLESMLVRVVDAIAVSATNSFGELWVRGRCATGVNARGGVTIADGDMNPERIQIDDVRLPGQVIAHVGDRIGDVTGIMSYRFGNFELLPESMTEPERAIGGAEYTPLRGDERHVTIASFNVRNLTHDDAERNLKLAQIIVENLRSPDIVALQEIQDDSGPVNDGTVDASLTFGRLSDAVFDVGGPRYEYRDIAPEDGQDGGEGGGNIRVGFLFRPDRVTFADRGRATASTATSMRDIDGRASLSHSPGRIDPMNDAWRSSRKPLAAEIEFGGRAIFAIACHFISRGGSTPLFGATQPPLIGGDAQRREQARVVAEFVDRLLAVDPSAAVVVLGDFNDFQCSPTITSLARNLANLTDKLPPAERYTYTFEGNSQALDHILVSRVLARGAQYDIVHVSSGLGDAASDHDAVVARLPMTEPQHEMAPVAFPNPFRSATRVAFTTLRPGFVEVCVYDVTGRLIRSLRERHDAAGEHDIAWDGLNERKRSVPAGVYFIRVSAGGRAETTRVIRLH